MARRSVSGIKFNWNQTGMPVSLVCRQRRDFSEFKSVLNDAVGHVMQPVDAEGMARELANSDGREYVEIVRELTSALSSAERELAEANRRYERLKAALSSRGIDVSDDGVILPKKRGRKRVLVDPTPAPECAESSGELSEWDEWDRKFRSLLG